MRRKRKLGVRGLTVAATCLASMVAFAAPAGSAVASNWTLRQLPPVSVVKTEEGPKYLWAALSGVSCPTQSLCVAVGSQDTVAVSQSPTGGAATWHVVNPTAPVEPGKNCSEEGAPGPPVPCANYLKGGLGAVSCASPDLCVAVGSEGAVDVSDDPTGGAGAWSMTNANVAHGSPTHLTGVSCPSTSLCVAVSGQGSGSSGGKVLTSTDPTAGQWQVTQLASSLDFRGVSCGTPSLCVAVAREGRVLVSTNPTGGASAWKELGTPGGPGDLEGVACTSTLLCVAGNQTGNVLTSTRPAEGGSWSEANAGRSVQITGVSCPTASRCVAVDNNGDVFTSTDPTGGPTSWHAENLVPFEASQGEGQFVHNALFATSCASASLCALVGSDSRIFTSTAPFSATAKPAGAGAHQAGHHAPLRPRTVLVFAENFWHLTYTRHRHFRARFHFYSPTRAKGFECNRDRSPWRRCHSPLRYWVGIGRHVLRVRAVGPTGLRGRPAVKHFRVSHPPLSRSNPADRPG
jgi:hypothetical protein